MSEKRRRFKELEDLAIQELAKPEHLQNKELIREYIFATDDIPVPTSVTSSARPREIDPEMERRRQEEQESHMPFSKRARTDQENLAYVNEYNPQARTQNVTITKSISNLSLSGKNKPLIDLKTELIEPEDEAFESDKNVYGNPAFRLGTDLLI